MVFRHLFVWHLFDWHAGSVGSVPEVTRQCTAQINITVFEHADPACG